MSDGRRARPAFRQALLAAVGGCEHGRDVPAITNIRHIELLTRALEALRRAQSAASANAPEEFVLVDLPKHGALLEEITGSRTADDVLAPYLCELLHREVRSRTENRRTRQSANSNSQERMPQECPLAS